MPHMGLGLEISSKMYISDPFEKSIPNRVTYLSKIFSKSRFPEGGAYTNRVKMKRRSMFLV